ncbi:Retinol dehydrogenase 13 [Armadillidium vulgare]|nr:Retinol dehydrogenase 13 [Armadillidium vulgare]
MLNHDFITWYKLKVQRKKKRLYLAKEFKTPVAIPAEAATFSCKDRTEAELVVLAASDTLTLLTAVFTLPVELDELETTLPIELDELETTLPIELDELDTTLPVELDKLDTTLPVELSLLDLQSKEELGFPNLHCPCGWLIIFFADVPFVIVELLCFDIFDEIFDNLTSDCLLFLCFTELLSSTSMDSELTLKSVSLSSLSITSLAEELLGLLPHHFLLQVQFHDSYQPQVELQNLDLRQSRPNHLPFVHYLLHRHLRLPPPLPLLLLPLPLPLGEWYYYYHSFPCYWPIFLFHAFLYQ